MAEAVFEFRIACVHDDFPCGRVHFMAARAGLECRGARFDRLEYGRKGPAHGLGWLVFARPAHVPHALQIGAVAVLLQSQVDMHEMSRLDADIFLRLAVSRLGLWAAVDNRTGGPIPGAWQAALAEFAVHELRQVQLADTRPDLGRDKPNDGFRRRDGRPDALARRF